MQTPSPLTGIVHFGIFQLDLTARELHKAGVKVKLQDQPLRVLALLIERAGQLVTRDELRQKVWPTDVYVDFDQGLNNAIRKVRDALGDSADSPRFIETVARHGYRFVAPVSAAPERPSEPRSHGLRALRNALFGLAACLLAALAYWAWQGGAATRARVPSENVILAVLPFDNLSRDPDQEFFSDGLTEEMIAQLGKLNPERLTVIARGSVAKYKGSSLAVDQISRELHADYLLQGSVRRASDRVRITVQLIQVRDQSVLWAESYDRELKDILALQDSVSRTVADQIHVKLTPGQQARLPSRSQIDPGAYEAYLKGRYYWNKRSADGLQKALIYFQQAINKDPIYGAAYSGLADCNSGLAWHGFKSPAEALPKANAAALKAIEIDPQSAEAHASLGLVLDHKWDWAGAEAEFKRALQLDPRYANAHHWYGDNLSILGRHDAALLEAKQALELDPLNLMIGTWVSLRYYLARKYDLAIQQGRSTVELDANFAAAHLLLGENYVQMGLDEKGLAELHTAADLSGNSPLYLAQVAAAHAAAGRRTEALRIIAELQTISTTRYVSPYGLAQIYAAMNDQEQTFKWLQVAYDDGAVWMSYLGVDPVFDGFRRDPRFQDLLRRVHLLP
ncbi:MAG TPA: winged helix-turn-helix domain-containing protein [Steroidobacteraceae bacterium]|jgi:TolB-like protein/DNA-binding winged helix-turn-helix (wHTH) protein|nr:winged helix-turn-helix domain-containing protein [Steroidobacteraceae bacterium]